MLKRLSTSLRLILFMPILLVMLALTLSFALNERRHNLMGDRRDEVKQLVQVASGAVESWYQST